MTLPVFVVTTESLEHTEIELSGDEGRHAVVVRRIRPGERVMLTDGRGAGAVCVVRTTVKQSLVADVEARVSESRPQPRLVVVQAIPKGDHAERAVDLLTEIGADVIVPWAASRNVVSWNAEREVKALVRWRATAVAAAKQSRRLWFPEVTGVQSTEDVRELVAGAATAVVLHEEAATPIGSLPVTSTGDLVVVVGPEGGITDHELAGLEASGASPVRLGSTVLRSSSAGLAASSVLLSRSGRWSG